MMAMTIVGAKKGVRHCRSEGAMLKQARTTKAAAVRERRSTTVNHEAMRPRVSAGAISVKAMGPMTVRGPMPRPETMRATYMTGRLPDEATAMSWPRIQMAEYRRMAQRRPQRSLMKYVRAEPTPAPTYTRETKSAISFGLVAEDRPKACWKPGSDGMVAAEPWSQPGGEVSVEYTPYRGQCQ